MIQSDQRIPIIYYHSVGVRNPLWARSFLTLEHIFFEDQVQYFARHFTVISLSDFFDIVMGLKGPVKNPIVITFDDGYLDNWIWAFPVLKKYGVKATVFVSPEFVDPRPEVRPNLDDVWAGRAGYNDISRWGYLSWEELRLMEQSSLIDIQSHTMSHTKYFTSDVLTGFHPGADSFYALCNKAPERKPYSISDAGFGRLLPSGFPLFEEKSAVIARKAEISRDFICECVEALKNYDFTRYDFETAEQKVASIYRRYRERDELITATESESEYLLRLNYEISGSKKIIEKELSKRVDFLCWPHGDTSTAAANAAFSAGYRGVTAGKAIVAEGDLRFIPNRIGTSRYMNSRVLTLSRARYKVNRYMQKFPYNQIDYFWKTIMGR